MNATHFTLTYHCKGCFKWNQQGAEPGSQLPGTEGLQRFGFAQDTRLPNPANADNAAVAQHNNLMMIAPISINSARQTAYSSWLPKTTPPTTTTTTTATTTSTPPPASCTGKPAPKDTYDYIVVGAGAAGIPIADKLSEAGKKVLLLEGGPPSLGRYGGKMGPKWLEGKSLTRFDVPGLCNQIWVDSEGVSCTGIDQMAGCVLGGGAAVNAALWWKPNSVDWDTNFPAGWKAKDVAGAVNSVFKRLPGTDIPSMDKKHYFAEGFNILSNALSGSGWAKVAANADPDKKDKALSLANFMYVGGQRDGPLVSWLGPAMKRSNFKLIMNTRAKRVIRTAGKATGVEVEGEYCGTIGLTPNTGRVIVSAGVFNTAKILFRSGIGPLDQLKVVKGSTIDGATMIAEKDWIKLPVGYNLEDHTNTDMVIQHPDVKFYDFYQAWDEPIKADADRYITSRSGILAQSAPNIGPVFWEVIPGSQTGDNVARQLQYTARVEPSLGVEGNTSMTISQYLGRGNKSKGRLTINGNLGIVVSDAPYLKNAGDTKAVVQGIKNIINALKKDPKITVVMPPANQTVEEFVESQPKTAGARRSNHWIGTAKLGTDSGLTGGTSVVDLNAKVYGTDNIYVVDASIFPGMVTTNPTSYFVVAAEYVASKLLSSTTTAPAVSEPILS